MSRLPTSRNQSHPNADQLQRRIWLVALIGIIVVVSGCSMFKLNDDSATRNVLNDTDGLREAPSNNSAPASERSSTTIASPPPESDSDKQSVRLDGALQLGDTENLAYTPAELTTILNDLLKSEKSNSAKSLVKLYPDLTTQILMSADGVSMSWARASRIARFFDDQWSGNDRDRWQDYIQTAARSRKPSDLKMALAEFRRRLENGQPTEALQLRLSRSIDKNAGAIMVAEVYRLEGIAHLVLEHDEACIANFQQSMRLLEKSHPYQASQIALLLGEAYRQAGEMEAWKSSWNTAIDIQSTWLVERGLNDPAFWKRAAFLHPVSEAWPAVVVQRIQRTLQQENLDFGSDRITSDEAVIWALIGKQSLRRHESQNAILAFKKSEALVSNASLKEELQMQQAMAMIGGGQPGPASATLLRLSSKPNLLGDRAKSILATLKLQNGSLAQGMNLLQSSIKTSNQWPRSERLRAQADYGLAYLMRGREKQGVTLLNQVHDEFVKHGNVSHATQCLENLAAYYETTDQTSEYKATIKRLKTLESL